MRAGGQDGEAVLGGDRGHGLAQVRAARARASAMLVCGDDTHLDLRLQEFAGDPAAGRRLARASKNACGMPRATDLVSASTRKYSSSMPKVKSPAIHCLGWWSHDFKSEPENLNMTHVSCFWEGRRDAAWT